MPCIILAIILLIFAPQIIQSIGQIIILFIAAIIAGM